MVGGFPAPLIRGDDGWEYCASMVVDALRDGGSFVVRMSPEDAKRMFIPVDQFHEKTISKLRKRIRGEQPICPPWVEFCKKLYPSPSGCEWLYGYSQGCIINHEGRHRIEAAIREGIKEIPVVFRRKPDEYCHIEVRKK